METIFHSMRDWSRHQRQAKRMKDRDATRLRPVLLALALLFLIASNARAQFSGPGVAAANPTWNSEPATTDPALLHPVSRSIYINTGDLIVLRLYGAPDYNPTVRVTLEGTVQLPLIGVVSIKGLTLDQAGNLIAEKLKTSGMYRDPQVTLQILESTNGVITVGGEAHAVIPASTEHRLFEILALAGGLPATASHTLTINRPGVAQPIVVNLGNDPMHSQDANIPVYPGDTIVLARVGVVYMLGEFKTAGVIQIQQNSPLTLLQATSVAGGILFDGKFQDLRIIRTIDKQRTLVKVDVKRVMLGKDPDPLLQADDIVYLPTSAVKAALISGGLNVLLSVANLSLIATHY
jgi:polysaccharide export outer membrane protein